MIASMKIGASCAVLIKSAQPQSDSTTEDCIDEVVRLNKGDMILMDKKTFNVIQGIRNFEWSLKKDEYVTLTISPL